MFMKMKLFNATKIFIVIFVAFCQAVTNKRSMTTGTIFLRRQLAESPSDQLKNLTEEQSSPTTEKENSSYISFDDNTDNNQDQSLADTLNAIPADTPKHDSTDKQKIFQEDSREKETPSSAKSFDDSSSVSNQQPQEINLSEEESSSLSSEVSAAEQMSLENSAKISSDKLCEASSCEQCREKAQLILTTDDKYSCAWSLIKNGVYECKVVTDGSIAPNCDAMSFESSGGGGNTASFLATILAFAILAGVGIKLKKMVGKSSSRSTVVVSNDDKNSSFGGTRVHEMAPLKVSGEEEEWGWEDGPTDDSIHMTQTFSTAKEDDDLQMAMALSLSTQGTASNPPINQSQESVGMSSNIKKTLPTRSTNRNGGSSDNIINSKSKSSQPTIARDDIFASVGIASKPTFSSSNPTTTSRTTTTPSSWKDTLHDDEPIDTNESNWDDDLDELLG